MFKNFLNNKQPSPAIPVIPNNTIPDPKAADTPELGIVNSNSLLKERRKIPVSIILLKIISLLLFTVISVSFLALKADLDEDNKYLKNFGLKENTIKRHSTLEKTKEQLTKDNKKNIDEINILKRKIADEEFYLYDKQISKIRNEQLQWFDTDTKDGFAYGIMDSIGRMQEYFISSSYSNPDIQFVLNKVEIQSMAFNRNEASFSIKASNVDGNVFSLTTEFIEMMNSFDFFKNASVRSFTRQILKDGDIGTSFSIKLKIQDELEHDPADDRFKEYTTWETNKNKAQTNIRSRGIAPNSN
ncbi:hypothetical protein KAI58_00780 [Candidatus Gracilibacteria bacterium]|nr:hypothetical protein [Candidatus Gracilibacteria bacterium]